MMSCDALRGTEAPLRQVEDSGDGELYCVAVQGSALGPECHQFKDARCCGCETLHRDALSCVEVLLQRQFAGV